MRGYRTLIIGALVAILGIAEGFDWINIVPAAWAEFILGAIGVIMIYLRKITTTPVGESGEVDTTTDTTTLAP